MKNHGTTIRAALAATLLLSAAGAGAQTATAGSPSKLAVTLFKTELFDGTNWVTVLDNTAGKQVDLVGNAGDAFGQGEVPVGQYGKIRLTVANDVTWSTYAIGGCAGVADQSFKIDGASSAATTTIYFATPSMGGAAGWTANGSSASPLLMSDPIAVQDSTTTRVTIQFDVKDSVTCSGTTLSPPSAPTMHVWSLVVPPAPVFKGGDYWIASYDAWRSGTDQYGNPIDPASATADQLAMYRKSAGYAASWGGKVHFYEPNSDGLGIIALRQNTVENRRQLDETYCTNCGIGADSGGPAYLVYSVGADHRITLDTGNGTLYGAFSEDFATFIGTEIESGGSGATGQNLILGVQQGGTQTISGLYSFDMTDQEFDYPIVNSSRSLVSDWIYSQALFGWADFNANSAAQDFSVYGSYARLNYPANAVTATTNPFSYANGTENVGGTGLPAALVTGDDGTTTLSVNTDQWIAASPGGHTLLTAGDVSLTNTSNTPLSSVRYTQQFGILLKQAAAGTQTLAGVEGTWVLVTRSEDLRNTGTVNGDAVLFKGSQYGTFKIDVTGAATFDVTRNDDTGTITTGSGTGTFAIQPECVGTQPIDNGTRYAWNDASCVSKGGKMMDVGVLTATDTSKPVAWFVFNDDATVAAVVDPDGYQGAVAADIGRSRMLGFLVRVAR